MNITPLAYHPTSPSMYPPMRDDLVWKAIYFPPGVLPYFGEIKKVTKKTAVYPVWRDKELATIIGEYPTSVDILI